MKKMSLVLVLLCLPVALANLRVDVNSIPEVPVQLSPPNKRPLPVEVKVDSNAVVPVRVQTKSDEPLAVRIHTDQTKNNRIEVEFKNDGPLRVSGPNQTDQWLPVQVKTDRTALWISLIATVLTLAIVGLTLWTARTAVRSASAAVKSARATEESAEATKQTAEARLFSERIQEYASERMCKHLRLLFKWYRENCDKDPDKAEELAAKWVEDLFSSDGRKARARKHAEDMDVARRPVTHYFLNIYQLYDSGYVREDFVTAICENLGTSILDVVLPLEKALIRHIADEEDWDKPKITERINELTSKFHWLKELSSGASFRS